MAGFILGLSASVKPNIEIMVINKIIIIFIIAAL
jgi:hypothetical protein